MSTSMYPHEDSTYANGPPFPFPSDDPPPPPKSRPPALTPPPVPSTHPKPHVPITSYILSDDHRPSITSLMKAAPTTTSTLPKSFQHRNHHSNTSPPPPIPAIRSYARSPATTLSSVTPTPMDDDYLSNLSRDELIARLKAMDMKNKKMTLDAGQMIKDMNHHLSHMQQLKHRNFQLMTDNTELRDLCVYLDDERYKARMLAKEWHSFGTHISRVLKHEVSSYASKLQQLESKQFDLVRKNFELKQLCLLLDTSRDGASNDGPSSTPSMGSNDPDNNSCGDSTLSQGGAGGHSRSQYRVVVSQQILDYIHNLESRVHQLQGAIQGSPDGHNTNNNNNNKHHPMVPLTPLTPPAAVTDALRNLSATVTRARSPHVNSLIKGRDTRQRSHSAGQIIPEAPVPTKIKGYFL